MKYYLFILSVILCLISQNLSHASDCGSVGGAPLMGNFKSEPVKSYWYTESSYDDSTNYQLIAYGGVGRTTGLKAETYLLNGVYYFRYYENDIYDHYFTYETIGVGSTGPCNYTTTSGDVSQQILKADVIQPKCIGTNVTVFMTNTTGLAPTQYSVSSLAQLMGPSDTFTSNGFQFPISKSISEYRVFVGSVNNYPNYIFYPLRVVVENDLKPLVEWIPLADGIVPAITIKNYQSFTSIILASESTRSIISPLRDGFYQIPNITDTYIITSESATCGTQTIRFNQPIILEVNTTLDSINGCQSKFNVSFITPTEDGPFKSASTTQSIFSPFMQTVNNAEYWFIPPILHNNITINMKEKPTCKEDGYMLINYEGSSSDIYVNGQVNYILYLEPSIGVDYEIRVGCSQDKIKFTTKVTPNIIISMEDDTCVGSATIIVDNYQEFEDLRIYNDYRNINYTHNQGVFTGIPASSSSNSLKYKLCGNDYTINLYIDSSSPNSDEYEVKYIFDPPTSCSEYIQVNYLVYYKAKLLLNNTVEAQLGYRDTIDFSHPDCNGQLSVDIEVPYGVDFITTKIVSPAKCRNTDALVQIVAEDSINRVYLNDNLIELDENNLFYVPPGQHFVVVYVNGGPSGCYDGIDLNIPYENDQSLDYTVVKQDSTKCATGNGKIIFKNPELYNSLVQGSNTISLETGTLSNLDSNTYIVTYNHTVCGVGNKSIDVETDGQLFFNEIQPSTCNFPTGNGIYQPYIIASNGNIYTRTSLDFKYTRLKYEPNLGYIVEVPADYTYYFKAINHSCTWWKSQKFNFSGPEFEFTEYTPSSTIVPQTGHAKISNSTAVRFDSVSSMFAGSAFAYPNDFYGVSSQSSQFTAYIKYDGLCTKTLPYSGNFGPEDIRTQFRIYRAQCGTLDLILKFESEFLKRYQVSNTLGQTTDANGLIKFYYSSPLTITSKEGYTASYTIDSSILTNWDLNVLALEPTFNILNETCPNSHDGNITITNYSPDYIYALTYVATENIVSNSKPDSWGSLYSGEYQLRVISKTDSSCSYLYSNIFVGSGEATVTVDSTTNQCANNVNGSVTLQPWVKGVKVTAFEYSINNTRYGNASTISLPAGNYQYEAIVLQSYCKQSVRGFFKIVDSIFKIGKPTSECSKISVSITEYKSSDLTITLYNKDTIVGQPTIGTSATYSELKNGTYHFVVKDGSGCQTTSESISVIECPDPTNTPTDNPINNSNQLMASSSFLILLFVTILFF